MKTILTAAILGLTGLAFAASADAQDYRAHRNDSRHEHRGWFSRFWKPRHHAPRVERYWVPARTETVFAGYDHCGKPIYRTVCVPGYWATRPICN